MKKLVVISIFMVFATAVRAQMSFDRYFSVAWDINAPLTNKSYAGDLSTKGFQVGFRSKINESFFMGIDVNNSSYKGYTPRQTYYTDGGGVTTDFYNYVYVYGATLSGDYYFNPDNRLVPFVGVGVGANYNSYREYYNIYTTDDSSWGLLVRPQAGVMLKIGARQSWGLIGALHYDYSSAKSDKFSYPNFSNIGFRIGLVFLDY